MNKRFMLILISALHVCVFALGVIFIYSGLGNSDKADYAVNNYEDNKADEGIIVRANDYTAETETEMETKIKTEIKAEDNETQMKTEEETEPETETVTETEPESETLANAKNFVSITINKKLNIRQEPSMDAAIIGKIPPNGTGKIIRFENEEWALVEYEGIQGYCSREFILAE